MDREKERAIEWECQKILRQYYQHVDRREFEKAVALFTPDVDWVGLGVPLRGREEILAALHPALGKSTARHVLTNTVVNVIDDDHAEARSYNTLTTSHETTFELGDSPIPCEGPNILVDMSEQLVRTEEGWRIAQRRAVAIFRHDPKPIPLETWAADAGRGDFGG